MHLRYGGVVPEAAARSHLSSLVPVVEEALARAGCDWDDLDAIAVTRGPGLAPALLVGLNVAKGLSFARGLPLVGVNHLEGHIYANWLRTEGVLRAPDSAPPLPRFRPASEAEFPLVALIVSGGHSDLALMGGPLTYRRLGRTLDDAAGEAFDKVARMLGLGFPGGPFIQRAAEQGDPTRFPLPRAWLRDTFDFSFSGLKTAVLREVDRLGQPLPVADLAASFQEALVDILVIKTLDAVQQFGARQIALAGGVAANARLRERLITESHVPVLVPPIWLCTDNAAMIAAAGFHRLQRGEVSRLDLDIAPVWPIA
jgi:N6-L-threonylcarbamoyladenine synthase